jgi:4-amino-4-deoxy-L-arabinose transferase
MGYRSAFLILGIALFLGLVFQGSRGLYESTEGRYALCAREMLDSGNWLEPTLFGEPHWTKPPLAYWSMAAGVRLFGRNAWGARVPNAIFFALTALAVAAIGRRMWDRRTGFLAGLVYATALLPVMLAFSLNTDTFLTLWETLAILCFWCAERAESRSRAWWWVVAMWLAMGLAFETKGPPALMALIPIMVFRGRDPERKGKVSIFHPVGLLVFFVVGFSWYLYECSQHPGLLSYFLGDEIVGRVAGNEFGRNPEWYAPFTMYLPLIAAGAGLWSWYFWRAFAEARLHQLSGWRAVSKRHDPAFFLAVWLALPLIVFSLSTSRMYTYILPLFPAVALIAARRAMRLWPEGPFPRKLAVFAAIMFALGVGGKAAASFAPPSKKDMGALYSLCRADDAQPGTTLVLFQKSRELGLNFYASSPVLRTHATDGDPGEKLTTLFAGMRKPSPDRRRVVFICRKKDHRDLMLDALTEAGFTPAETWSDRNWFLARVELPATPNGSEE